MGESRQEHPAKRREHGREHVRAEIGKQRGATEEDEQRSRPSRRHRVGEADVKERIFKNKKALIIWIINAFFEVGMTRFELATTRPPDEYSKPD